jgi:hypothetical protein
MQAQRFGRLDALDVEDRVAIERGEIAAFTDDVDERAQDRTAGARERVVGERGERELGGAGSVPRESGMCVT